MLQQQDVSRSPIEAEALPADGSPRPGAPRGRSRRAGHRCRRRRPFSSGSSEGRFYVACVGQFKRGKSSLLNALAGSAVLPGRRPARHLGRDGPALGRAYSRPACASREARGETSVPRTSRPTSRRRRNSENRLGVEAVEVFLPSPLLSSGMCLVDTPGIGSVFAGNTMTTREFVPHVDAADRGAGRRPAHLRRGAGARRGGLAPRREDLFFVLNKADRLPRRRVERGRAVRGTGPEGETGRHALRPLLMVSATERLTFRSDARLGKAGNRARVASRGNRAPPSCGMPSSERSRGSSRTADRRDRRAAKRARAARSRSRRNGSEASRRPWRRPRALDGRPRATC